MANFQLVGSHHHSITIQMQTWIPSERHLDPFLRLYTEIATDIRPIAYYWRNDLDPFGHEYIAEPESEALPANAARYLTDAELL